jgi:hypothetical protein
MLEVNQLESEISMLDFQHRTINEKKHTIANRINRNSAISGPKRQQILDLKQRKRKLQARIEMLESQIGTPLEGSLSSEERTNIDQLQVISYF